MALAPLAPTLGAYNEGRGYSMSPKRRKTLLEDLVGITGEYATRSYKELLDQAYSWASAEAGKKSGSGVAALYATLGLLPTAEPEVIEAAYRALAKKYHPDAAGGDGHRMATITAAHGEINRLRKADGHTG